LWTSRWPAADDNRVSVGIDLRAGWGNTSFENISLLSHGAIRTAAHVAHDLRVADGRPLLPIFGDSYWTKAEG